MHVVTVAHQDANSQGKPLNCGTVKIHKYRVAQPSRFLDLVKFAPRVGAGARNDFLFFPLDFNRILVERRTLS